MIQEHSYVDENGCNLTCPSKDSQTEVIPEVCQQPELQSPLEEQLDQPIETSNNLLLMKIILILTLVFWILVLLKGHAEREIYKIGEYRDSNSIYTNNKL